MGAKAKSRVVWMVNDCTHVRFFGHGRQPVRQWKDGPDSEWVQYKSARAERDLDFSYDYAGSLCAPEVERFLGMKLKVDVLYRLTRTARTLKVEEVS